MKIVIGGQLDKDVILKSIQKIDPEISVEVKSDIDAAMDIQSGNADFYMGACATGAGGAIMMAMAVIGATKTCSVSTPGKILSLEEMRQKVEEGNVAFGMVNSTIEQVVPDLLNALKGEK